MARAARCVVAVVMALVACGDMSGLPTVRASPADMVRHKYGVDDGALPGPYGLMLVVGRVEADFARVLYEGDPTSSLVQSGTRFGVRVWAWDPDWGTGIQPPAVPLRGRPVQETSVVPLPEPRVLVLEDLVPDVRYVVEFAALVGEDGDDEGSESKGVEGDGRGEAHEVVFSTLAPVSQLPLRMLVVACDRYTQDKDSTLVTRMARDMAGSGGFDVMVHMGDQVREPPACWGGGAARPCHGCRSVACEERP